jgi:ribonuclease M5
MAYDKKIKEVVVVEGYHDLAKLLEVFPTLDIVITNGSEISQQTLDELRSLNETRGLILFLDPDYQGERIRRIINDYVGDTKHAFLKKHDCISKNRKKVGIEHASKDIILKAFDSMLTTQKPNKEISIQDLYQYELIGHTNAKQNRKLLCETLGIGLCNGKTLAKKLNMFGINKEQIESIIEGD